MLKIKATRTCREFTLNVDDPRSSVNCPGCVKWNREIGRCKDEEGVAGRYEDTEVFETHDRMMRSNKGVYLG